MLIVRIEPREFDTTSTQGTRAHLRVLGLAAVVPLLVSLLLGGLIFLSNGIPPLHGLHAFFIAPLSDRLGLTELLVKAAPLALIACGLLFVFRANVWNIGAEGQFILGAIGATGTALFLVPQDSPFCLPALFLGGVIAGAAWAGVVAWLRAHLRVNEILCSLMLVYVAQLLLHWLVQSPWRDPQGYNFPETALFESSLMLPILVERTRLHLGVLFVVPAVALTWLLLNRSLFGLAISVAGRAPRAARFAGFSQKRIIWMTLLVSGGFAGLAGAVEVVGLTGQLVPRISPGYGFTAIIVAFLGGLHPLGVVAAALLVALTYLGGEAAQVTTQLPYAAAGIFQGLLLFSVLAFGFFSRHRVRFTRAVQRPAGQVLQASANLPANPSANSSTNPRVDL